MQLNKLKTFADACKVLGLDPKTTVPTFYTYPAKDRKAMVAHAKLVIIARAANRISNGGKEWKPDWNNHGQDKYYPWFEMGGSSGFRFYDFGAWFSLSYVGSRLCFISYDVAAYIGKQFFKLYKDYFVM